MTSARRSWKQRRAGNPSSNDPLDGYLTEPEWARQRNVTVRTCQRDRALRKAPPHIVIGRTVYYRIESIREWLITQER